MYLALINISKTGEFYRQVIIKKLKVFLDDIFLNFKSCTLYSYGDLNLFINGLLWKLYMEFFNAIALL